MKYPERLYKFYPLFESEEENEKRLDALRRRYFWLSEIEALNDPTEFNYFTDDQTNVFNFLTSVYRENHLLTCFSETLLNLPMWSHYTNNHRGFCVEYEVEPWCINLYKVKYSDRAKTVSEILSGKPGYEEFKSYCDRITEIASRKDFVFDPDNVGDLLPPPKLRDTIMSTYYKNILCLKNADWRYEREYRIILPMSVDFLLGGNLLPYELSFLKPRNIFVGINCSYENEDKLKAITRSWKTPRPRRMKIKDFYK